MGRSNQILILMIAISFVVVILDLIFKNLIFYTIFLMLILSVIGVYGGKWLWKELASSNIFKSGIPIYIKIFGCVALVIFFIFIGIGFNLFYSNEFTLIRLIVQQGTLLMIFITFYNIGYLISIWKPRETAITEHTRLQIMDDLAAKVITCNIVYISICVFFYYLFGWIYDISLFYLILGGIGFSLGWLFWEHLKESKILSGKLLKDLKLVSALFELPVIIIMILGIISNYLQEVLLDKIILFSFILLFYLMAAYFIGLMLEIIKK